MAEDYEKYGVTKEQWDTLGETDREKLTSQNWEYKLCITKGCGRQVLVLASDAEPHCMYHGTSNQNRANF